MDRYEWCGVEPGSEVKNMLKRYKMYYNEAVDALEDDVSAAFSFI